MKKNEIRRKFTAGLTSNHQIRLIYFIKSPDLYNELK